jgi:sugar lactone lactonase YvrE
VADDEFSALEIVCEVADLEADVRFNDGAVAPDGSFWAGTLSHTRDDAGALFRIDSDHQVASVLEGVSISNGMDWSGSDGRQVYVDSGPGTITILNGGPDDAGGWRLRAREPFFDASSIQGGPDGLTIDATGYAWVAIWGGGRVIRLSPAGEIVAEVRVPAPHTSSVAFGGADLRDLFITTARENLDDDQLARFPLSGSVFRWRSTTVGRPAHEWLG